MTCDAAFNKTRYSRQTVLPEIGEAGQARLASSSVLCVGAGGLGSPLLLYLAGSGVGRIGIIDHDLVSEDNLHRQVLYTTDDIGAHKSRMAQSRLRALNPDVEVEVYTEAFTACNADIVSSYDVVIDGTDNFAAQFLLSDAAVKYRTAHVYAAILGFSGQVGVFDHRTGRQDQGKASSCYRCLFAEPPTHHVPDCAQAGVLGPAAGMIGSIQAMEVLKLLLDDPRIPAMVGHLLSVDMRTMVMRRLAVPHNQSCPVCTKPDNINFQFETETSMSIKQEHARDVHARRANGEAFYLMDVRELDEWEAGHIDGADFYPLSSLMEGQGVNYPKSAAIVVYCRSGQRSLQAAQILQARGYTDLTNMAGGILAWPHV